MPVTIILLEEYEMKSSGVKKKPGTELTFSNRSEEATQILSDKKGVLKKALPKDLPGRKHFEKAGFDSIQSLAVLEEWTQVKGIGKKKAEELDNYFKSKNKGE